MAVAYSATLAELSSVQTASGQVIPASEITPVVFIENLDPDYPKCQHVGTPLLKYIRLTAGKDGASLESRDEGKMAGVRATGSFEVSSNALVIDGSDFKFVLETK